MSPKENYLHATEKCAYALSLMQNIPSDTISLTHVQTVRRQLSDASGSLLALERALRLAPEPVTGETEEGK